MNNNRPKCTSCKHYAPPPMYTYCCVYCDNDQSYEPKENNVKKPHPHRDLILAWADGAKIEVWSMINGTWTEIDDGYIIWREDAKYRIKPEPVPQKKPDREVYSRVSGNFYVSGDGLQIAQLILRPGVDDANIVYVFDGETGVLKSAEVLKCAGS